MYVQGWSARATNWRYDETKVFVCDEECATYIPSCEVIGWQKRRERQEG